MTAASPSDILRAVERWARVRGWWMSRGELCTRDVDGVSPRGDGMPGASVRRRGWACDVYVSPAIALAFALLVESGAASVDVGRCPACVARSGPRKLVTVDWLAEQHELGPHPYSDMGFSDRVHELTDAGWQTWRGVARAPLRNFEGRRIATIRASRPCPACTGTGREAIPAERLLLDAVSGDARARDLLLVRADQLQAAANPLGDLLAWALRLWTGEPTDCGPCQQCDGNGYHLGQGTHPRISSCTACGTSTRSGSGRQLGHPHTAEAVRWLEWLMWARGLAAERERQVEREWSARGYPVYNNEATCQHCQDRGLVERTDAHGHTRLAACPMCRPLATSRRQG